MDCTKSCSRSHQQLATNSHCPFNATCHTKYSKDDSNIKVTMSKLVKDIILSNTQCPTTAPVEEILHIIQTQVQAHGVQTILEADLWHHTSWSTGLHWKQPSVYNKHCSNKHLYLILGMTYCNFLNYYKINWHKAMASRSNGCFKCHILSRQTAASPCRSRSKSLKLSQSLTRFVMT